MDMIEILLFKKRNHATRLQLRGTWTRRNGGEALEAANNL